MVVALVEEVTAMDQVTGAVAATAAVTEVTEEDLATEVLEEGAVEAE